ncbi:hypothetical protein MPL3365_30312 [Mesorhizobium plurifarium]|uniref:Uncharacterized protein n=1 Tax=Mesorhizobium plurifarium TaxID=69974 RepID=A0A090GV47_MESPL|nr:hypothetical protein MPL3365_30312 [Mesorhizobium plurifarium]
MNRDNSHRRRTERGNGRRTLRKLDNTVWWRLAFASVCKFGLANQKSRNHSRYDSDKERDTAMQSYHSVARPFHSFVSCVQ